MKKSLIILISVFIYSAIFAQQVEIVKTLKFNQPFKYYEEGTEESFGCGISTLFVRNGVFFIQDADTSRIYDGDNLNVSFGPVIVGTQTFLSGDSDFIAYHRNISSNVNEYIYLNFKEFNLLKPEYKIISSEGNNSFYLTDGKFFSKTEKKELIYWDLLDNGNVVFHDETETRKKLNEGLGEFIGLEKSGQEFTFGETSISRKIIPASIKMNEVRVVTQKYSHVKFGLGMTFFDKDERGFLYFKAITRKLVKKDQINDVNRDQISFIVLDPWLLEAYVIDLGENDYTPPKKNGIIVPTLAGCVDEEGNIYFSDCNKEKQQYEIKKLNNEWLKQFDFFNREIGRMNSNHIELYKAPSRESGFDGYNFDHEYLWILEHGKEWSKVRKIDGREGWVENKYINFNGEKKTVPEAQRTNVSVNKLMTVHENLRLREAEATSSTVITTMQAGTKIKILELGKLEQIDGITSNWVKVEVQTGAKDRDGKPIKAGTVGWCYGGYLK